MLSFIFFTALAVLGFVSAEWLPFAVVFSAFLGIVLLIVKMLWPIGIMSLHRYTVTVADSLKYSVFLRWIVTPIVGLLCFLGFYLGARHDDFRITLVTFYLLEMGCFCVYPLLRWLLPKIMGYLQIKKACKLHGFAMTGRFRDFLFPKDNVPAMTVETPSETFSVLVLGTGNEPQKYNFGHGLTYRVQKVQHYVANFIDELEHEGDCTALQWIKALYFGKEKEKTLPLPAENVTNILLFAPDFAYCTVEGEGDRKGATVEVGNVMKGYEVYNVRTFVRGRLAGAAHEGAAQADPAMQRMPNRA